MAQYKTGTATVTNNSPTVTGTNTLWLANVTAGDSFTVAGDGVMYDVASVDSDTQVTLSVAYQGVTAAGAIYTIARDFTSPDNFPELTTGDIETPTIITRAIRKIQSRFTGIAINTTAEIEQAVSDHEATNDHPLATTIAKGFLSAVDKTKLDTVESGATADQTDAEIKIAYESNANTNEFSDAEQTKLLGIEDGATADQTKADIDALNIDADTLDGIDSLGFDAAGAADTAVSDHVALPDPHSQYAELSGGASANFTAMPQVGGDPIVESGSNADGEWTRWADGTQIVTGIIFSSTHNWTATPRIQKSLAASFLFPYIITGTCEVDNGWASSPTVSRNVGYSKALSGFYIQKPSGFTDSGTSVSFTYSAIGRWK